MIYDKNNPLFGHSKMMLSYIYVDDLSVLILILGWFFGIHPWKREDFIKIGIWK